MKRAIRCITVFIVSFSVIVCSSFSVFASYLVPLYSSENFYNSHEDTGVYPTVPSGFSSSISSLNGRMWLSDVTNFDNDEWEIQTGFHNVFLSGVSSDRLFIVGTEDNTFFGFEIPSSGFTVRLDVDGESFCLEANAGYASSGFYINSYTWTEGNYNSPDVERIYFGDNFVVALYDYFPDVGDFIFYSAVNVYYWSANSIFYSADNCLYNEVPIEIPVTVQYKTYTVTAMLDVNNSFLSQGQQYMYEFDKLGIVYRDTPHVMRMQMIASYLDEDFNFVTVNGETGYVQTLHLYQNPFPSSTDNYRDYTPGTYYDHSFSDSFTYSHDFIEAGVKWIWFRFTIRCDTPVLLFPGTLNVYSYSDYMENQRYEELQNSISYIIDGDTGVPEVKIDTSDLEGSVQEQDAILDDIYSSLDSQTQELLIEFGYSSMVDLFQSNMNDMNDFNMLASFDFVKMLFNKVISATGLSALMLFTLTFGFAMYVLGRRLT